MVTMETPPWGRFRAAFPAAVLMEGMEARCPRPANSSMSLRKTSKVGAHVLMRDILTTGHGSSGWASVMVFPWELTLARRRIYDVSMG